MAIADWRSAGFNELISSSVVGGTEGNGDGVAEDFGGVGGPLGDGNAAGPGLSLRNLSSKNGVALPVEEGGGDCASKFAAKIDIAKFSNKNRDMTVICRRYSGTAARAISRR